MKPLVLLIFIFSVSSSFGQSDTLTFSAFGDFYYSYDFSNPPNHEKPNFIYNHKRHNELNVNILLVEANYASSKVRGNLGLMLGNYAQYTLSAEPTWAQFVYESNLGVKISKNNNLWFDVGIFSSHLGSEGPISSDCWTLTRSLSGEGSPYYEAGAKVSYTSEDNKWFLSGMYLNGWQRIVKPDNIQKPSFGMQVTFKPTERFFINYSNFIGSDKPDSLHSFRHFHDFYFQFNPSQNFGILGEFDIGFERIQNSKFRVWYTPVLILRQKINPKFYLALRGEYYSDPNEIIVITNTKDGFQTFGISSNFDYHINKKILFRFEGRMFKSKDSIFKENSSFNNFSLTSNLSIRL